MNKRSSSSPRIPPVLLVCAIIGSLFSGLSFPAQVEAATLPSGITHHWKLDDGSGTTAVDSVGNADGTITSPDWTRKAQDGSSVLKFASSDTFVEFASGVSMPSGDWSFAAVIAIDRGGYADAGNPDRPNYVLSFGDHDGGGWIALFLEDDATNSEQGFRLKVRDAANTETLIQLEVNEYFQLPVIVQGGFRNSDGTLYLRVNRKETSTTGADVGTSPAVPAFFVGRVDFADIIRQFQGWAGDVVWWDGKFLSSAERDDVYASLITRINGSDPLSGATVTKDDAQIDFTAHTTPYNGEHSQEVVSNYTPLFTTADNIYVSAPVNDGVDRSKVARLNKNYVSQENVIIDSNTHNTPGHRGVSAAVDPNGTVVVHPSLHSGSAQFQHSTSPEDLSTLTATADPAGCDLICDYRRFLFDSVNNKLRMAARGNMKDSRTAEWNDTNKAWDTVWNDPFSDFSGLDDYSGDETVASNGTIYKILEPEGGPGALHKGIGLVKSSDAGVTWTDLEGNSIDLDVNETEYTYAIPSTVLSGSGGDSISRSVFTDSNDDPVVIAAWRNELEGESKSSMWMARWNNTGQYFLIHRLDTAPSGENMGSPRIAQAGTEAFVIYADKRFHDDPNWPGGPLSTEPTLYLLLTRDGGASWTRYILDDGTGYGAGSAHFEGAYIDLRAFGVDGVQRILPLAPDDADLHEIWEFSLPSVAATSGSRGSAPTISSIQAKEITSTSAIVTWHTSTAAETRLVGEGAPEPDPTPKTRHEVSVTNLSPETLYQYTIHAKEPGSSAESTASLGLKTLAHEESQTIQPSAGGAGEESGGSAANPLKDLREQIRKLQLRLIPLLEQLATLLQERIQAASTSTTR